MPDINQPDTNSLQDYSAPHVPATKKLAPKKPAHAAWLGWPGITLALLVVAACGGAWWFMGRAAPPPKAAPPPLHVPFMIVKPSNVAVYRSFPATTQAMRIVPIQARVTGYLREQGAVDGADVAAGALLYRIDAKDYEASFAEAQAQLRLANASLRYTRATNGRNQILAREGWASRDMADQTDSNFNQGRATLANNGAALNEAALNLSRTEIRAPFAGRISASQVFAGSLISVAGATLNTLVQLDPIYVSFDPAQTNLQVIQSEQARAPIQASVYVIGGTSPHTGALTFVDNQISQSTGTILLRATIANPDHALLPGEYVTVRLHLGDLNGALLIPQKAVGATQIGRTVMVLAEGNTVAQRFVTLGDNYGENVVVTSGLKAGDRVITGQLQKLKPAMQVVPAEESMP
jgi:multidrug efflux system membrane fusion protein